MAVFVGQRDLALVPVELPRPLHLGLDISRIGAGVQIPDHQRPGRVRAVGIGEVHVRGDALE